ncbi:MAG: hypothetical protein ABR529_11200 [Actinomycetota bacterium]
MTLRPDVFVGDMSLTQTCWLRRLFSESLQITMTNRIRVVKRQAYGMRNFDNFRDRVLVQCGVPKPRRNPRLIA